MKSAHTAFNKKTKILAPELGKKIKLLASREYQHPHKDELITFGASTIERWYYKALNGTDPVGALNLRIAKKLRRAGMAEGGRQAPEILEEMADRFFPFPKGPLLYWPISKSMTKRGLLRGGDALKGLPSHLSESEEKAG